MSSVHDEITETTVRVRILGLPVAEVLHSIADEIEADPSCWTSGAMARTKTGRGSRYLRGRYAVSWCLAGHLWKAFGVKANALSPQLHVAYAALMEMVPERLADPDRFDVISVNDHPISEPADIVQWCRAAADRLIAQVQGARAEQAPA